MKVADDLPAGAIKAFNTASEARVRALLAACAPIDRWIDAVLAARPYACIDDLMTKAGHDAQTWTLEEIDRAYRVQLSSRARLRVGEQPHEQEASAQVTRSDQAVVYRSLSQRPDLLHRLRELDRIYETRFGRPFHVRTAGRSVEDILALLDERLSLPVEDDNRLFAAEFRESALIRLYRDLPGVGG
jgi:2-oxo-4-hydroxy-4-carboxy-5-ureidoimidazoline decarboxylase